MNKKYDYDSIAKNLGFKKLFGNNRSHGQVIYKKGNIYISPDIDSHIGGVWKMFKGKKMDRQGTFNEDLSERKGK